MEFVFLRVFERIGGMYKTFTLPADTAVMYAADPQATGGGEARELGIGPVCVGQEIRQISKRFGLSLAQCVGVWS